MTLRRVLFLLCIGVCATALVGCGGDTFALDPVANAANKTAETESARVAFSASFNAGSMGTFSMDGKGIFDGRSKTGWMGMTLKVPPAAQAQVGANPRMEMIFDGSDGLVMYMRSSMFPGLAADKWVKLDLEKLADEAGIDRDGLMNANQADPNQALRMLMGSSGARVTGTDTVRGVRTTRYSFRIDLERLADENEELRKTLKQVIDVAGVEPVPAQAWIDAQGRVRRFKLTMSMGAQLGTPMTMTMTEDLYDFGVKANIYPPPASQTVDFSALLGSG
jgi:hypothetical protein